MELGLTSAELVVRILVEREMGFVVGGFVLELLVEVWRR